MVETEYRLLASLKRLPGRNRRNHSGNVPRRDTAMMIASSKKNKTPNLTQKYAIRSLGRPLEEPPAAETLAELLGVLEAVAVTFEYI
jgi:hypothetical protein